SADAVTAACDERQRGFDLEQGPLAGLMLANLPGGEQRLLLSCHHLIVDGVSWRILLEDLARAYQQAEAGLALDLGAASASYGQWAHHLGDSLAAGRWHHELDYWVGLAGRNEPLPVDNPDGRGLTLDASHCEWR